MSAAESPRQFGRVFDAVAAEYDAYRPTYPDELVDQAAVLVTARRVLGGCRQKGSQP